MPAAAQRDIYVVDNCAAAQPPEAGEAAAGGLTDARLCGADDCGVVVRVAAALHHNQEAARAASHYRLGLAQHPILQPRRVELASRGGGGSGGGSDGRIGSAINGAAACGLL